MKKISSTLVYLLLIFHSFLYAPETEDDKANALYAYNIIQSAKSKKESKSYKDSDMMTFLMAARLLKNGEPVEDIELALAFFKIVEQNATNVTLRENAQKGISDIEIALKKARIITNK